jgi:hypothetical protein
MGRRAVAQGIQVQVDLAFAVINVRSAVDEDGGAGLEEIPGVVSVGIEIVKSPLIVAYSARPGWRAVTEIGLACADRDHFYLYFVLKDKHQLFFLVDDDGATLFVAERGWGMEGG